MTTTTHFSPNLSWISLLYLYAPPPVALMLFPFRSSMFTKLLLMKSKQFSMYLVSNLTKCNLACSEYV